LKFVYQKSLDNFLDVWEHCNKHLISFWYRHLPMEHDRKNSLSRLLILVGGANIKLIGGLIICISNLLW
jgi:hypothetical protein